jgi:hypothetical protein
MVKYADGPSIEVEIAIDADPETVWALVCDIELPAEFSPEFQGAEWVTEGPELGARFHGRNKHVAVGEWTTESTVTGFEATRTFEWTVGDLENKTARWRFDLAPDGDGSILTFSAEMGPGQSGLSVAIEAMPDREEEIVANRLVEWETNMTATIEGIKARAEAA